MKVSELDWLIEIEFEDGSTEKVASMIRGRLLELNKRVFDQPELVNQMVCL